MLAIIQQKLLSYFPSDMVHSLSRNLSYTSKVDIFRQKVETYSRCCSSICTIAPGFHIFDQRFSLTRFFPKKCVNFSLPRQKIQDKIRSIIRYKRHNQVNTYRKSTRRVSQSPLEHTIRSLPTSC